MCGALEHYKSCYSADYEQITLGNQVTVEACQTLCDNYMSTSGKDGCCNYAVDWKACKWQDHLELKVGDDQRYGALCKTRKYICLLILSTSPFLKYFSILK